jgi:hypothetical protein
MISINLRDKMTGALDNLKVIDPKGSLKAIKFMNQSKQKQGFGFHKFQVTFCDDSVFTYYYLEEHDFNELEG